MLLEHLSLSDDPLSSPAAVLGHDNADSLLQIKALIGRCRIVMDKVAELMTLNEVVDLDAGTISIEGFEQIGNSIVASGFTHLPAGFVSPTDGIHQGLFIRGLGKVRQLIRAELDFLEKVRFIQ